MLRPVRRMIMTCVGALALVACGPEIGDKCDDALDCATDGSRFCDHTQPGGYCLIPGCRGDECPEEAVCVRFGLDEQARTFCLQHCSDNGDCRDGYRCIEPDPYADVPTEIVDLAPNGRRYCLEHTPYVE
jgi:hypothetical protein